MDGRSSLRLVGLAGCALLFGSLVACSKESIDDAQQGTSAAVTAAPFDKNNILDDKYMRDSTTITADDLQNLLENTPWNTTSVLATYTENGKTAAQIMAETAAAHNLNPLEMITRVQMEQGLISATTASADTIAEAFGCGCPDGSTCADQYKGFASQAECAAGTMDRAVTAAQTATGTVSGWARSKTKTTEDSVDITPVNATTAALYTYTPWVGEAGGGKAGVGGTSLHYQVWDRFAQYTSYGPYSGTVLVDTSDAGADASTTTADAGTTTTTADAGTDPSDDAGDETADAGTTTTPSSDGGVSAPPSDGSQDGEILGTGSAPSSDNAPPPSAKISTKPADLPEATDDELTSHKTAAGCAAAGHGNAGSGALIGGAIALSLLVSRRRRHA